MKRFVFTVDLPDKPGAIAAYTRYHRAVWPAVLRSLRRVGVRAMDIYLLGQRLVMVMETTNGFDRTRDFARHAASDPRCAEWEERMRGFQKAPPGAKRGELWALMKPVFSLTRQVRELAGAGRASARTSAQSGAARTMRPARKRVLGTKPGGGIRRVVGSR